MNKRTVRKRRSLSSRMKMRELNVVRLCVNRTSQHVYAQLIETAPNGDKVLASACTLDQDVKSAGGTKGTVASAAIVGNVLAKKALTAGVTKVAFDRSGFKYHGVIKALAEAAREGGLQF